MSSAPSSVEQYLAGLPDRTRALVVDVLAAARRAAPDAGERISYGMPTVTLDDRPLVHVGGWKTHVGLYPLPDLGAPDAAALARDLAPYATGRGTARIPLTDPIPGELVERLVSALVAQRHAAR